MNQERGTPRIYPLALRQGSSQPKNWSNIAQQIKAESNYLSKIGTIMTEKVIDCIMPRLAFDVDEKFSREFSELVEATGAASKAFAE